MMILFAGERISQRRVEFVRYLMTQRETRAVELSMLNTLIGILAGLRRCALSDK